MNNFAHIFNLKIGQSFVYNDKSYTLADYRGTNSKDYFTVCVFKKDGGTKFIRIKYDN